MTTENHKQIIKQLEKDLETFEVEIHDVLVKAEKGIKLTKKALGEMRNLVLTANFKSTLEEITFFKKTKPRLYSKLIYYVKLFNIECKRAIIWCKNLRCIGPPTS